MQASALKQVATASICTVVCVTPYFYYMWFSYNQFCTGGVLREAAASAAAAATTKAKAGQHLCVSQPLQVDSCKELP
jgi:hypothetical protein